MSRILIVDDHLLFGRSFARLLNSIEGIQCDHYVTNGENALKIISQIQIDLVTLDINMPNQSGFDLFEELIKYIEPRRILIITMHDSPVVITHFLKKGAAGFLSKSIDLAELEVALKTISNGGKYVEKRLNGSGTSLFSFEKAPSIDLSRQERRMLGYLHFGLTSKEIADKMCLSLKTIESYRENLLRKTMTKNVAELISFSFKNALLHNAD